MPHVCLGTNNKKQKGVKQHEKRSISKTTEQRFFRVS